MYIFYRLANLPSYVLMINLLGAITVRIFLIYWEIQVCVCLFWGKFYFFTCS